MYIKKINPKSFEKVVSNFLKNRIETLLQAKDIVFIALPGGSTPMPILSQLAKEKLDWSRVCFYQTDERVVPIDKKENNYSSLNDVFFSHIKALSFPMYTGEHSPEVSCESYIKELKKLETNNNVPRFDLIVLGMGEDGHIASLFPGSNLLEEKENWVAIDPEKRNGTPRMTLTFPVLFNAGDIVLIISGLSKIGLVESETARHALPIDTLIKRTENLIILCMEEK